MALGARDRELPLTQSCSTRSALATLADPRQRGVFRPGLSEDRDVGVSPAGEEIPVGRTLPLVSSPAEVAKALAESPSRHCALQGR